jgi:N-acetylmuramoyl-L-alanine amidase
MRRGARLGAVLLAALYVCAGCTSTVEHLEASSSATTTEPSSPGPTYSATPLAPSPTEGAVPRPPIVWKPIPFPLRRKSEMAAYAERHYGTKSYRLEHPRVIVEHVTVSHTFAPVFTSFSQDVPDRELHELPGLCTHFVIDTDGTIYQLVSLSLMCRHTVGLNYTAIGIEHVGLTDQDVLDNPEQLGASIELTLWLTQLFDIRLRNVIGHNESLASPFHHELVPRLRCQTHGDWTRADMEIFRERLAALAVRYAAHLGPPPRARSTGC